MDPLYRVRQFFGALRAAPLTNAEIERVRAVLNEDALALYQSMPLGDQRHGLKIFDALRAQSPDARPLLQAALLHDVAKREVGLVPRSIAILLRKFSPRMLPCIASANPHSWRYPLHLSLRHPAIGAELAQRAGIEQNAVKLIRAHQEMAPAFDGKDAASLREWHRALKLLDDVN